MAIIQNGTIEIKSKQANGINPENGHPIRPTEIEFGSPIPCQYLISLYDKQSVTQQGEPYTASRYDILIEKPTSPFIAEQIRLKDLEGHVVGEFSVRSIVSLDAVGQVKITV